MTDETPNQGQAEQKNNSASIYTDKTGAYLRRGELAMKVRGNGKSVFDRGLRVSDLQKEVRVRDIECEE